MMNFNRPPIFAAALGLTALAFSCSVLAEDSFTWNFSGGDCTANCSGSTPSKTFQPTSATTPTLVASAWANTEPGSWNNTLATAGLNMYSGGLGVTHADGEPTSSPNHATDNNYRYELVLFDFGAESIALTDVALGWYYNDSDLTVLRYAGVLADPTSVFDSTRYEEGFEELTSNGWVNEGNIDVDGVVNNVGTYGSNVTASFNADKDASSYWIVAAYNTAFGPGCDPAGACENGHSSDYDYFKIQTLTGQLGRTPASSVPTPPTFMLMALGLAWLGRRQMKSA